MPRSFAARVRSAPLLAVVLLLGAAACTYDRESPCPEGFVQRLESFCACPDGYELRQTSPTSWACEETGFGVACSPGSAASCPSPQYPTCVNDPAGGGYCTERGCAKDSDCPRGWSCRMDGEGPYCRRAPRGLGDACTAASDCAGGEATYCETTNLKMCLVQGCDAAAGCGNGYSCCDLTSRGFPGTLCLPVPRCPS